jgi:hypothetical protein
MSKGHYYLIAIFSILFFASLLSPLAHASTEETVILQQIVANESLGPTAQIIYLNKSWTITGFKLYIWVTYTDANFKGIYYGVGRIGDIQNLNKTYSILYTNTWTGTLTNNTYTWVRFDCHVNAKPGYYFLWVRPLGTLLSFLVKVGKDNPYPDGFACQFKDTASTPYFYDIQNNYDWAMYIFGVPYTDPTTVVMQFIPALVTIAMLGVALGLMSRHLKY